MVPRGSQVVVGGSPGLLLTPRKHRPRRICIVIAVNYPALTGGAWKGSKKLG